MEWCTRKQNAKHAADTGLYLSGFNSPLSREVIQMDLNGKEINRFGSCRQAQIAFGRGNKTHIGRMCKNPDKHKSCYGFKWKFAS